jgi:hypothetical protein
MIMMKRMLSIEEIWLLLVTLQSCKRFPAVRFDRVIGVDPCDHSLASWLSYNSAYNPEAALNIHERIRSLTHDLSVSCSSFVRMMLAYLLYITSHTIVSSLGRGSA